jgi:hypothetical protein
MPRSLVFLIATVLMALPNANAAIINLFNTGVNAVGAPLTDNAIDPHYAITYINGATTASAYVATAAGGYPIGPWLGDNTTSAWITPAIDTNGGTNWVYRYTTTFDLTGLNPLTAVISGRWAGDDGGGASNIFLNGVATGQPVAGFTSWTNFTLNSGFIAGVNTLSFQVQNSGGGPTGVRVEMSGTATANAVPDGGSVLLLLGLLLVAGSIAPRTRR